MRYVSLRSILAAVTLSSLSLPAVALSPLTESPHDYRIKTVEYNERDIAQIDAVVGLTTHIWLDDGEEYVTHAFGDPNAWELADNSNHIFIKPRGANGDTNLVLITNQRVYNILLKYVGSYTTEDAQGNQIENSIQTPWSMRNATVQLRYTYPEQERAQLMAEVQAAVERERIDNAFSAPPTTSQTNLAYVMSDDPNSRSIAPESVWDDSRFTYFKFPRGAGLPNLYVINSDGEESLVETHVEGRDNNIIVGHRLAEQWVIRSGSRVVGVQNNAYDPAKQAPFTGTSSREVRRVIRGGGQ